MRNGFKTLTLATALVLGFLGTASAGKPGACSNVPVSVSFVATDTAPAAAITNDDSTRAYKDGVDGVSAIIFFNLDCNGTRDMVIDLSGSTRTLNVNIPSPIPGSLIQSGPAPAGVLTTKARINVRDILARPISPTPSVFYTTVAGNPFPGPTKQSPTYRLLFTPDVGTCPAGSIPCTNEYTPDPLANSPVEAAWVKVTYTPRDVTQPWSPTNTDSWIVDGELTTNEPGPDYPFQRGTLFSVAKNGSLTHLGQYSMPFKMTITALAALPQ